MKTITPEELADWRKQQKDFILIDVRENWERDAYNIGGVHIPLTEMILRKGEISLEKDVVIYCEKGIRSNIIIQRLEAIGYNNLYNLTGGMNAWRIMDTE